MGPSPRSAVACSGAGRWRRVVAVLVLGGLPIGGSVIVPPAAQAQATLSAEVAVLGANAFLGGLTSGLVAWLGGGSFVRGFGGGAAGGSVQYIGKRVVTASVPGAGLTGRLMGAAGASMVRNGAARRGLLDELVVPLGPVSLYWTAAADSQRVAARLHLGRAIFLARMLAKDELRLDWAETFSAGAPVLRAPGRVIEGEGGGGIGGLELWGIVSLSDPALLPPTDSHRMLAHERVHVLQDDFLNITWADPLEDWLLGAVPGGTFIRRYVDVGVVYMGIAVAGVSALSYEDRPWEDEAAYLESGW